MRERLTVRVRRGEEGFTLVEVLIATLVLTAGIIATISVFGSSKRVTLAAERNEVAVHQAQREMEALKDYSYAQLGLTAWPQTTNRLESDPTKIGYFNGVNTTDGSSFTVASAGPVTEHFVGPDDSGAAQFQVNPAPTSFTVGNITGKVYRYVTWRPEDCGTDGGGTQICPGYKDTKRLTVAVQLDPNSRNAVTKPVWIQSIAIDASSGPP